MSHRRFTDHRYKLISYSSVDVAFPPDRGTLVEPKKPQLYPIVCVMFVNRPGG